MNQPVLSVVMLVYNGEKYLKEAIDSVLLQTFKNFELLIINDGSFDGSANIVRGYADERVRYFHNEINRGIPYCRNLGLQHATGEYLTWTDCDDINLPTRFEEQINFLNSNPQFGICGTWLKRFGTSKQYIFKAHRNPDILRATLLFKPSIPNATAMLRLSKIKEHDLSYNIKLPIAEDYDFIFRCSKFFRLTNIPKVLYLYRASETSIMKNFELAEERSYEVHKIVYKEVLGHLGIIAKEKDLSIHRLTCSSRMFTHFSDLVGCFNWLMILKSKNDETKVFEQSSFNKVLATQFFFICRKASNFGIITLKFYFIKGLRNFGYVSANQLAKFVARCIIKYDRI